METNKPTAGTTVTREERPKTEYKSENFCWWSEGYDGFLFNDGDDRFPTEVYAYHNTRDIAIQREVWSISGAVFGYVFGADVEVNGKALSDGEYFCCANRCRLTISSGARVIAMQRLNWLGLNTQGGPIEERGRLRYIDKCSDTLLIAPVMKGDACLNHLHFPAEIDQTAHTHPSTRCGMVASGTGECVTPEGKHALKPGVIFYIPRNGMHSFNTLNSEGINIIAYHPDSDFGPEHEEHPMVNRTLVDGVKIDNSVGVHLEAEVINPVLP